MNQQPGRRRAILALQAKMVEEAKRPTLRKELPIVVPQYLSDAIDRLGMRDEVPAYVVAQKIPVVAKRRKLTVKT